MPLSLRVSAFASLARPGRHLLLLVLIPWLLYAPAAAFDFVRADDTDLVVANQPFLRDLGNFPRAFSRSYFEVVGQPSEKTYYRPVVVVSLMLDAQVGGANPMMYHVTNIALHSLAVLLLYQLLAALGTTRRGALLTALVFAVHPLNVQTVCWVPGRNDSLMTLGGLVSLVGLVRYSMYRTAASACLHVIGLAAALFSKETAVMLVPLFFLYTWLWREDPGYYARRRWLLASYAILLVVWFGLRQSALAGGTSPDAALEPHLWQSWERTLATLWATAPDILIYLGKVAVPYRLSTMPGSTPATSILGVVSAALLTFLLVTRSSRRKALFVACWFVLFLAPTLLVGVAAYENRAYFPLAGLMVGLAPFAEAVASRVAHKRAWLLALVGILLAFAARTATHEATFRNPFTYWENATHGTPYAPIAHVNVGQILQDMGKADEAATHFRRALQLDPRTPKAHNNLGVALMRLGRPNEAVEAFRRELALHPTNAEAHYNLGISYKQEGRAAEAVSHWELAIKINRYYLPAYEQLATYYASRSDNVKAQWYTNTLRALQSR